VSHIQNPRVEVESHYYNAKHQHLLDLGLKPHYLGETLLDSLIEKVGHYAERVDPVLLAKPSVSWRTGGNEVWKKYSHKSEHSVSTPKLVRPGYSKVKAAV
jgi:UDP-sulfoquinovose synthase